MSIDRYDPIRVIGEGSFGKVYLMRDKVKRSFVCVKIIKIKNIPKKEREATRIEVDLLRRLNHPNIVRYVESFLSKNKESLCICMEYCDGGDLASQVKAARRNLFSEGKILHWFVQLALGLHYMHSNKVLHRDLKTQNVFMLGNGRLVLGDLGISKVLDGTMDFAQTCIGTPYYMSPEIFKNKPYSYKSDVWALGCVLYEMTTLNHAFDANSLNGLATKIIKGKYPPIHAKYSRHLRELIGQMLLIEPKQRPDLSQILRQPFIKKHVINFFTDIANRPSNSLGEGTMIFKAAAGGPVAGAVNNDSNMISLRQQLSSLDMQEDLNNALQPKAAPQDDSEALKLAKDQASALKREKEHKKMVEAALEKLRQEREVRAKQRGQVPVPKIQQSRASQLRAQQALNAQPNPPVSARREESKAERGFAAPTSNNRRPLYGERRKTNADDEDSSVSSAVSSAAQARNREAARVNNGFAQADARRRRSFGEDRERILERERKAAEDKKRVAEQQKLLEQEAQRIRIEERRREEARAHLKARNDAAEKKRLDDLAAERERERQKESETAAAQKKALDVQSRRDALRERERAKQREEIEQLKRDKLELDRRTTERDRLREEQQRQQRSDEKGTPAANRNSGDIDRFASRAEDKYSPGDISARDRVNNRRQEKAAKDEQDRLQALRDAEEENRRIRIAAREKQANLYHAEPTTVAATGGSSGAGAGAVRPSRRRSDEGRSPTNAIPSEEPTPRYDFDANRPKDQHHRSRSKNGSMDVSELNDKLTEVTKGSGFGREESDGHRATPPPMGGRSVVGEDNSDDSISEDGSVFGDKGAADEVEEDEDLQNREEELKAELQFATHRVSELKKTLEVTKSFLGDRAPTRERIAASREGTRRPVAAAAGALDGGGVAGVARGSVLDDKFEEVDDEDDEDEDDYDFGSDSDGESATVDDNISNSSRNSKPPSGKLGGGESKNSDDNVQTLRVHMNRGQVNASPPRNNQFRLQDQPSPSGRLSDRIERLRKSCIEALGAEAFQEAYTFLRQHEEESQGYDNGRDMNDANYDQLKTQRMRSILGEGKAKYTSLIEQLIFMEETHCA